MLSYLKDKEKNKTTDTGGRPWYKVYSLKDYKRMQNEVKLGTSTLGPDLNNDSFRERVRSECAFKFGDLLST
jgi:hypothetical protein